ncbi:hypothetical protein PFTANZ_06684, partial [Plasmodium falciparum Tanzania (2000708)]
MAPSSAGTNGYNDAKDFLDKIGQEIYKKVHTKAVDYRNYLQGHLENAIFEELPKDKQTENDPCKLKYGYHTTVTSGYDNENPCKDRPEVRFSYTEGAQCDDRKIRGSNSNKDGACAPFRRLHICDYNLENINRYDKINNHTLLVDVCQAAKFEAESLINYRARYQEKYKDTGSPICTVLARSFADIGDIIRGKDLYLGNPQEKTKREQLEKNLKTIFKNIYEKLLEENQTNGRNGEAAKERYKDTTNFYRLREDWWDANRETVWKALTCDAGGGTYFRQTCNGQHKTQNNCRCRTNDVPTYFDYVPQYLRWFEEWAEDFCRKKKKFLYIVKTNCRDYEQNLYCSGDGFDCTKTKRAIGKYAIGDECTKCSFWCGFYKKWLANQKQEFLKQKKKCENEIIGNGIQRRSSPSTEDYEGYEKYFHEEFQRYNNDSKNFLGLLSKETECKELEKDNENKVDFMNTDDDKESNNIGTFYYSKYCEECPECGVEKGNDGQFVNRTNKDAQCNEEKEEYKIPTGVSGTKINVLYSGKGRGDITEKLKDFCKKPENEDGKKNEKWQCYYESADNNMCKMTNAVANDKNHDKIMSFNDFFNFWVAHVLNDSIDWRKQLTKCLSEDKLKKCEKGCKSNCECFKKWIRKKETEWIEVKNQFNKQKDIPEGLTHYKLLETILEDYYFENIQKAYGDLKSIQEMKKMIEEHKKNPNRTKDDEDAIDVLFDHEKEEAEDCLDIHEDDDECVEESEKIPNNPCSGTRHRAMVKNVAAVMHLEARQQLTSRGGGRKALRGDASQGEYNRQGKGSELQGENICNINTTHSNDDRSHGEPCTGKDGNQGGDRMKIGTPWTNIVEKNKTSYKDVFLPPRREHMCTSNLENLKDNGKSVSDTHTLLGEVALSAKMDAKKIIDLYKKHNSLTGKSESVDPNHKETICRAVRYSFADLGDIIRGRDMWDKDDGSKKMEGHLKKIFGKIKEQLPQNIKDKYKDYDKTTHKYKRLREDWWEANRRQVWKSMQCALKSDNIQCRMTPDDYIPQRLRWMTEWAEWYCKYQAEAYKTLQKGCEECMRKGESCTKGSDECATCKQACDKYKEEINKWRKQWEQISGKYQILYWQAKNDSDRMAFPGTDPDYKQVVHFFKELQKANGDTTPGVNTSTTVTTPYSTAEGYIHQELPNVGCNTQTEFCDKKNGNNNINYTFKHPPKEYEDACECDTRNKPPETAPKKEKSACEIVEEIYRTSNNIKQAINSCYRKNYNGWTCDPGDFENGNSGACMPPRRKSLCIHSLEHFSGTSQNELKEAFIKCAAAETCLLWKNYKEHKEKEQKIGATSVDPDNELKNGNIPEDFKRQMFYTYGDYRDLCLGTDISSKKDTSKGVGKVKDNIHTIFKDSGKTDYEKRKNWWKTIENDVWDGMLCGLSHASGNENNAETIKNNNTYANVKFSGNNSTTLEEFAKRPQFLRWLTEWGEDFCREQKKQLDILTSNCPDDTCTNEDKKKTCSDACKAYKEWLSKWKENYNKQSEKYFKDKAVGKFQSTSANAEVNSSTNAYEYLNKVLQKICTDDYCKCMDAESSETSKKPENDTHDAHMPKSLDEEPKEVKGKCSCTPPPSACDIVQKLFEKKDENEKYFHEACSTKYKNGKEKYTQWKCINDSSNTTRSSPPAPVSSSSATSRSSPEAGASVNSDGSSAPSSTCIPPRRQQMYIQPLQSLSGNESQVELRTKFIEMAAIETFFQWHKFKKEKVREIREKNEMDGKNLLFGQDDTSDDPNNPQNKLNKGEISDEFIRQMFYTFGDYRDILFGKTIDKDEDTLNDKINKVFANGGSQAPSSKKDIEQRKEWWNNNAKDIWDGMVCALSYDTETKYRIESVHTKLKEEMKDNKKYNYKKVTISSIPISADKTSITTTNLSDFANRPTFFRWLEEWAQEFCKKRTHKLAQIKHECRRQDGTRYCDGDGFDCNKIIPDKDKILSDFNCPSCAKSCNSYKQWINTKKREFNKQQEKYTTEIDNNKSKYNNIYDEKFVKNVRNHYRSVDLFLKELKDGSCSNKNTKDNIIVFNDTKETFRPAKNCSPCPVFGGKFNRGNWSNITEKTCENKKITEQDIKNVKNPTEKLNMLVSDNITKEFTNDLSLCEKSSIFEGITKDEWTCVNLCKSDICFLKNLKQDTDDKQNILIRTLFKRWVENFLKDYNKINDKISQCKNNKNKSVCIKDCTNKCNCVDQWIENKMDEWVKVRNHYLKPYKIKDSQINYDVRRFLNTMQPQTEIQKVIGDFKDLEDLEKASGCNYSDYSENSKEKDVVECLLNKLKNEINDCKNQTDDGTNPNCVNPSPTPENPEEHEQPPDDYTPTTTDDSRPAFCKDIQPPEEPKEDSDRLCDDNKQPKCKGYETYSTNIYEAKVKLIGLGAHYHRPAPYYPNIYLSPRVQQLCLQPLKELKEVNKNTSNVSELIEALKKCAYNEAKGLYNYYKDYIHNLRNNGSTLSEKEIETYTLEAMKRSYADYGNIVKGNTWWIYPDKKDVDTVIISATDTFNKMTKSSDESIDDDSKRLQLWKSLRNDIWKAMLCGYQKGKNNNAQIDKNWCTVPTDDETDQFLRWFKEWGESFCIRREQELKRLKEKCENGICNDTDEAKKQECKRLCENYKQFLKMYENQYKQQSIQYRELESSIDEFKDKDPFTFLKEKCNAGFSCFKDINENELNNIFQYPYDEVIKFCTCTSKDTSKSTPSNCIDKAAYEVQQEVIKNIGNNSNNLKGKEIDLSECRKGDNVVVDNSGVTKKIDKDKLKQFFPPNIYSCETNEINDFHMGKEWDCNYRNINFREKGLCLPPRRQFMCIKKLEDISTIDVNTSEKLFKEVNDLAKKEAIRILRNYQEQNKTDFSEICDDMKYSFADLGDIIRGRDLLKKYPKQRRLQQKLHTVFKKIYNKLQNGQHIYKDDNPYYYNLRNDWWEANRKDIWKTMTCSAPKKAYIYETTENSEKKIRSTNMHNYCGHNHNPPYDDYIPQRLRWMKEWGEYVCKILNEKIDDMKNDCQECKLNNSRCRDDDDGNKCRKCKSKCKEYTELIQNLKSQFSILEKKYNDLYKKAKNKSGGLTKDSDKHVIEFFEKVKKINTCNVDTADKYLDKASHCINYNFIGNQIKTTPYIFNNHPEKYKNQCVCTITNHPLDKCPFRHDNKALCNLLKEFSECKNKTFDNKLDSWGTHDLKYRTSTNQGVFIPPRRTRLCLKPLIKRNYAQHDEHNFLNDLLTAAYTEAYALGDKFKNQPTEALKAIKWSFADYGDIIKGTDMIDNMYLNELKTQLETIIKYNGTSNKTMSFKDWWEYNKNKVWHVMLCGYNKAGGTINHFDCNIPSEENTDQFLRWFQEWTEAFCSRKNELYKELEAQSENAECLDGRIYPDAFKNACEKYRNFIANKKIQYDLQMYQYNKKYKNSKLYSKEGPDFLKNQCNGKCDCLSENFIKNFKLENPYETLDNEKLKNICDCQKSERIQPLPPADQPFDPTILHTTIPFGIAFALGSIAFLFLK